MTTHRRPSIAAVALAAWLPLALSCSAEPEPRPVAGLGNVILITIDTLRADHVGAIGYERPTTPNIDRLAASSAVFTQAIAQSSWTRASMASLMTGLYPTTVGLTCHNFRVPKAGCDLLPQSALTLAEAFRADGLQTASVVANINVDPVFGFDQGFETIEVVSEKLAENDPDWRVHDDWYNETTRAVTDRAIEWLAARDADAAGFLLNLHYLDPHDPYDPPADLRSTFDAAAYDADPRSRSALALYDAEIRHVDEELGRLFDFLEREGLAAETAIVIVADHGEEFHDHGGVLHGFTMFDEQIRVPLIIRLPGLTDGGVKISQQVRMLDVMPTLLESFGVARSAGLQGRSLIPLLHGEEIDELPALSEWGYRPLVAWRAPPWKLIYNIHDESAMLFHLGDDPTEQHDLAAREPARVARMTQAMTRELTAALEAGRVFERETGDVPLTEAQIEQLQGLGYIDGL